MWLLCLLVEVTCRQRDDRLLTWAAHQARTARCTCSISVCVGHFYQNFVWHQFAEQERHALLAKPMQQLNGMSRTSLCAPAVPAGPDSPKPVLPVGPAVMNYLHQCPTGIY